MKVREARAVASRWVAAHAGAIPGFAGAFLSGSVIWLPAEEELPATSDVDVLVVTADHPPPPKLGKLPYGGLLVEVSFLSWEQLGGSERVLGSYHLAGSFRTDTVLADRAAGWVSSARRWRRSGPPGVGSAAAARTPSAASSTGSPGSTPHSRPTAR
jgi:hypothetical protein